MGEQFNKISIKNSVGKTLPSKECGDVIILDKVNHDKLKIKFINTGFVDIVSIYRMRNGNIRDKSLPAVCGIGVLGNKYPSWIDGKPTTEYKLWHRMLQRCNYDKFHENNPTYENCTVSDNFKDFTYFHEWCNKQIGFGETDFALDKDLLVKGNKHYSEDTCVFIPIEVNSLLTNCGRKRGKYPVGVSYHKHYNKFISSVSIQGIRLAHLGCFDSAVEAFNVYKQAKESIIKEQANRWKGWIDDRAYEALMNYEIDIND